MSGGGEDDRQVLREAWDRFSDQLRAQGHRVIDELDDVDNPQELAEALRSVARMAAMVLVKHLEFNDPDFPVFFRVFDDRFKMAGPDTYINYLTAPVRGTATYRIEGNSRGRDFQLGRFWNEDLTLGADGGFEIIASAHEQGDNWQPLDPALGSGPRVIPENFPTVYDGLTARTYYRDPADDREPGRFYIERIDDDRPRQPEPLSPQRLAGQLDDAAELLDRMFWWLQRSARIRAENQPNVIGPPGPVPPGVPGHRPPAQNLPINYGICCWELGPDEALVVETELPDADYWSFQLHNAWWESPDNQNRQTSISHQHAFLDPDGRFRCVLAHRDPGVPNWLDTGGSRRGFLFYRWVRPVTPMPTPAATLTSVDSVREFLPPAHPVVSREERDAQLARRRRWYAARFQG